MRRLWIVITLGLIVGTGAMATPASASFPGTDGRIGFGSDRYGHTHNIFTMNPDGSDVRQLTFLTSDQGAALNENWSPDGTQLVFEQRNPDGSVRQIYVTNADGSNQHLLFADPSYTDRTPDYSPDGSRVVFSRCGDNGCAIYTVGSDGQGLTAITRFGGQADLGPEYSPDGKSIVFESRGRGGVDVAVYVMNANGGHLHRITAPELQATEPDWSPDGSRIVVDTNFGAGISSMRPDGTDLRQLTFPAGRAGDFAPEHAPAGDRIAFERDHDGQSFVYTMNPDGTGLKLIQNDAFAPSWGPAA